MFQLLFFLSRSVLTCLLIGSVIINKDLEACSSLGNHEQEGISKKEIFSDVFYPLSISYLHDLFDNASPEIKEELNSYFQIKKKYGVYNKKNKKLVSYSLFWKATHVVAPQPVVTEESIYEIRNFPRKTTSFYEYYILPMINTIKQRTQERPDWVTRIYLAEDLEFLVDHLLQETKAEIYLMSSSSISITPGCMWRFLAFDDPDAYFVCVNDSDETIDRYKEDIMLSWLRDSSTKGWFRSVSLLHSVTTEQQVIYAPIVGYFFGCKNVNKLKLNLEKAMKGFILHRQLYPNEQRHPQDTYNSQHPYGFGNEFPNYGFDERFLKHVLYYDAAYKGLLTVLPLNKYEEENAYNILRSAPYNNLVRMDIEFIRLYNQRPIYGVDLKF